MVSIQNLNRKENLDEHEMSNHNSVQVFSCDQCNSHMEKKEDLEKHVALKHPTKPIFTCNNCNFKVD